MSGFAGDLRTRATWATWATRSARPSSSPSDTFSMRRCASRSIRRWGGRRPDDDGGGELHPRPVTGRSSSRHSLVTRRSARGSPSSRWARRFGGSQDSTVSTMVVRPVWMRRAAPIPPSGPPIDDE